MKFRKALSAVVAIGILLTSVCGATMSIEPEGSVTATETLIGDYNGDGIINSKDIILFKMHLNGDASYPNEPEDVNGDGSVDINDIYSLSDMIFDRIHIHQWSAWETVIAPTETGEGVAQRVCTYCDMEQEKVIPMIGSTIGCVHQFTYERTDLAQYGCCGGTLETEICTLCDQRYICFNYTCESFDCQEETITDSEGQVYNAEVQVCQKCGLEYTYGRVELDRSGCEATEKVYQKYKMGDTIIYEGTYTEKNIYHDYVTTITDGKCGEEHTFTRICSVCGDSENGVGYGHYEREWVQLDLATYGGCGGTLEVYLCSVCGEIEWFHGFEWDPNCTLESSETTYTGQDGYEHTVNKEACTKCGLEMSYDTAITGQNGCMIYEVFVNRIAIGDTVIAEERSEGGYSDHTWQYEISDGICGEEHTYIGTCLKCDETTEGTTYGHHVDDADIVKTDLAQYGCCGGTVSSSICKACGVSTLYFSFDDVECNLNNEYFEYTDDAGKSHAKNSYTCTECGLVYVNDRCDGEKLGCKQYYKINESVVIDGKVIAQGVYTEYRDEHTYTYELIGGVCGKEHIVRETCKDCGISSESVSYGHHEEQAYMDLTEYGACGGEAEVRTCSVCQKISSIYLNDRGNCEFNSTSSEEVDGEGRLHSITSEVCNKCGLTYKSDRYDGEKLGCMQYVITYTEVSVNDTVIAECSDEICFAEHIFERELIDGVCGDEHTVRETCKSCGEIFEGTAYGHHGENSIIELSVYGCCGGTADVMICELCGKLYELRSFMNIECDETTSSSEFVGDDGYTHIVSTTKCSKCGIEKIEENIVNEINGCDVSADHTTCIRIGDTVIIEERSRVGWTEHDFEYSLISGDCSGEYTYTMTCRQCGYSDEYTGWGHIYAGNSSVTDLTKYGCCGGVAETNSCSICGEGYISFNYGECEFEYSCTNETDENGILHTVNTQTCTKCGLKYISDEYLDKKVGCVKYCKAKRSIYVGDTLIAEGTDNWSYDSHNCRYEITSGECGGEHTYIEVCSDCGYASDEYMADGHHCNEAIVTELSQYGACGGNVEIYICEACGETSDIYLNTSECLCNLEYKHSEETDADGNLHDISAYVCGQCGFTYVYQDKVLLNKEGCRQYFRETRRLQIGENVITQSTRESYYEEHDFTYEVIGGTCDMHTYIQTCSNCGTVYESQGSMIDHGYITLSCTSTVNTQMCRICGRCVDINADGLICDFEITTEMYTDENGVVYEKQVKVCKDSGVVYTEWYTKDESGVTVLVKKSIVYGDSSLEAEY